jgi:hypothetical protein
MPNWCENTMKVYGTNEELEIFVNFMKGEDIDFDFSKIISAPKNIPSGVELNNWRIDNWGTRGNAENPTVDLEDGVVFIVFETAWSPSVGVTLELSKKFPTLSFNHHYQEAGNDFSGVLECINGEKLKADSGDFEKYFMGDREDYFEPQDD